MLFCCLELCRVVRSKVTLFACHIVAVSLTREWGEERVTKEFLRMLFCGGARICKLGGRALAFCKKRQYDSTKGYPGEARRMQTPLRPALTMQLASTFYFSFYLYLFPFFSLFPNYLLLVLIFALVIPASKLEFLLLCCSAYMHYATSDWYTPHRAPTHYFQLAPTATVSSLLYIYSIYFLAIFISYFVLFLSLQIFKCKDADQAKASGGLPAPAMRNCSLYSLPLS